MGAELIGGRVDLQAARLFPTALVWTVVLGGIVIFLLATVAGAWVYKEEPAGAIRRTRTADFHLCYRRGVPRVRVRRRSPARAGRLSR